jgi:Type I restriction modification DNA specificity domain
VLSAQSPCSSVRRTPQTASTDTHVAVARANTDVVRSDYLYAYLRGAQGQHQLRSRERGDWQREKISFRLTELNLNDLRKVPIPVPPFSEQRRIVVELNALQAEVDALKRPTRRDRSRVGRFAPLHPRPGFQRASRTDASCHANRPCTPKYSDTLKPPQRLGPSLRSSVCIPQRMTQCGTSNRDKWATNDSQLR